MGSRSLECQCNRKIIRYQAPKLACIDRPGRSFLLHFARQLSRGTYAWSNFAKCLLPLYLAPTDLDNRRSLTRISCAGDGRDGPAVEQFPFGGVAQLVRAAES